MSKNSGKARYQEIRDLIGMSGKTTDFRPSNTYLGFGGSSDVSGNKTTNSFANQNFQFEPLMRITKLQTKESKPQIDKRPSPFSANLTDLYFPNNRPQSNMASQKDFSSREEVIYSKQEQGVQKDLPPIPNFREPNLINESNFEILKSDNEEEYELTTKLKPTKVCPVPTEHGLSFDLVFNEAEALKKKQKSGNRAYLSTATTQVTRNSPKRSEEAEDDLDDLLSKRPFIVKKGTDASAHLKNYASSSGLRLNTAESDKFAYPFKKTTELRIINMMSKSIPNWRQNSVKNLKTETSPLATPILGARPFTAADTKLLPIQKSATFKSKRSSVSSKKSIKNQKSLSNLDELSKETSAKPTQNELPPEVPENAEEKDPTPEPQLPPLINTQSSLSPRGLLQAVLPPIVEEKDHGLLPLKDIDEDPIKLTAIVKGNENNLIVNFRSTSQYV